MSNQVPPNEQGELQGTLTGLMSLTAIFGPLLMTHLFSAFTGKQAYIEFPGAPFLVGAVLLSASSIWAYRSLHGPKA
jgi:DHA1 family tetracycline resistance protein-like MFS transporter